MHVSVTGTLNVSAATVWERVRDFGSIHTYQPGVINCTLDSAEVGAVRTLHLADGRQIRERLESRDDSAQTLSFTFEDADTPLQDYHCTVSVRDLGDGCSEVGWSSVCAPHIPEAAARGALEGAYSAALAGLQKQFSG